MPEPFSPAAPPLPLRETGSPRSRRPQRPTVLNVDNEIQFRGFSRGPIIAAAAFVVISIVVSIITLLVPDDSIFYFVGRIIVPVGVILAMLSLLFSTRECIRFDMNARKLLIIRRRAFMCCCRGTVVSEWPFADVEGVAVEADVTDGELSTIELVLHVHKAHVDHKEHTYALPVETRVPANLARYKAADWKYFVERINPAVP